MSDVNDELDGSPILEEVLGDALGKLKVFHVKLAAEGEPRGLIGPRDVGIIWERHILNSAAIVPFIREATAKRQFKTVADIGSGGGFPGIVAAACLPDHQFTLVEPMERRNTPRVTQFTLAFFISRTSSQSASGCSSHCSGL